MADAAAAAAAELARKSAEVEEKIREVYKLIAQLDAHKGETIDIYCTYDVKAGKTGAGANGQYLRQCRNFALEGTNPPLCHAHARKNLLRLIVEGQSQLMKMKKQDMRKSVRGVGVFDPNSLLVTVAEYKAFRERRGACIADLEGIKDGGVFGRDDAICKAFHSAGYTA